MKNPYCIKHYLSKIRIPLSIARYLSPELTLFGGGLLTHPIHTPSIFSATHDRERKFGMILIHKLILRVEKDFGWKW